VDFAIEKLFPLTETRNFEFRAEFFNLFNHQNFANPISNLSALFASGGSIAPQRGRSSIPATLDASSRQATIPESSNSH